MVYLVIHSVRTIFFHNGTIFILITIFHSEASFGGIFGLCLGGSVISLVELLYFYTLRLYSIRLNHGACSSKPETKHVSINSAVKTIVTDPKTFLHNFKAYQEFDRQSKYHRKRMFRLYAENSIVHNKTVATDIGRPIIHTFLE